MDEFKRVVYVVTNIYLEGEMVEGCGFANRTP